MKYKQKFSRETRCIILLANSNIYFSETYNIEGDLGFPTMAVADTEEDGDNRSVLYIN